MRRLSDSPWRARWPVFSPLLSPHFPAAAAFPAFAGKPKGRLAGSHSTHFQLAFAYFSVRAIRPSAGRYRDDLDPALRVVQFDLAAAARRRLARHDPRIPYRVHRFEVVHRLEPDLRAEQALLRGARFGKQRVDLRQYLTRLVGDVAAAFIGH